MPLIASVFGIARNTPNKLSYLRHRVTAAYQIGKIFDDLTPECVYAGVCDNLLVSPRQQDAHVQFLASGILRFFLLSVSTDRSLSQRVHIDLALNVRWQPSSSPVLLNLNVGIKNIHFIAH